MNDVEMKKLFKKCGFVKTITSDAIFRSTLNDSETVDFVQRCKIDGKKWLMISTDKRLLIISEKMINRDVKEISYSKISAVKTTKSVGIFSGELEIEYSGGDIKCDMPGIYAKSMRDAIIKNVDTEHPSNSNNKSGNNDLESIVKLKELLDMGAITKEEFELKKKQILNI